MSDRPVFRKDLYQGTAAFYDRFRLPYPAALVDDLCRRAKVTGRGRLLDLACGPGTVTFALASHFAEVWAIDQEPEAVEFGKARAAATNVENVRWMVGRAEDVDPDATFDVVTIGTAFHRLDRRRVADLAARWLRRGGHLALLWSETALAGSSPWQQEYIAIVVDWMRRFETEDRVPADLAAHIEALPHATVVEQAGFVGIERYEFTDVHDWTVDELIGLVYSTSLLPHSALGDHAGAFEAEMHDRLCAVEPSGRFREHASFAYDLATWPVAT